MSQNYLILSETTHGIEALPECHTLESVTFVGMIEPPGMRIHNVWIGFQSVVSQLPPSVRRVVVQFHSYQGLYVDVARSLIVLRRKDWGPIERAFSELDDLETIEFGLSYSSTIPRDEVHTMHTLDRRLESDVKERLPSVASRNLLRRSSSVVDARFH